MAPKAKPHTGIYMIKNTRNGRFYIGSAIRFSHRWATHLRGLNANKHHSKFMQRDWNKSGPDCFEFEVLIYCEPEMLIANEQRFIDELKPVYNSAPMAGSQLGFKMSDESKAKLSAAAKRTKNFSGHRHSEESKAKIRAAKTGAKMGPYSEAHRKKISESQKGKVVPAERRLRISATLTGRKNGPCPEDRKAKISAANTGKKRTAEQVLAMSKRNASLTDEQVVGILLDLRRGKGIKEVSSATGVTAGVISNIKAGKSYKWVGL